MFTESQHLATISVTKVNVPDDKDSLLVTSLKEEVQQAQSREIQMAEALKDIASQHEMEDLNLKVKTSVEQG